MKPITCHLLHALDRPSTAVAVKYKHQRKWISLSWQEYFHIIQTLAQSLKNVGVKAQSRVAVCSSTRWEWACLDMAIMGAGAVTVPVYQSCLGSELEMILNDSEASVLVLENQTQWKKWQAIREQCPTVQQVILLEPVHSASALTWDEFLGLGTSADVHEFRESLANTKLDDIASIVYTSGTSGMPKGVVITHRQIIGEMQAANSAFHVSPEDVTLCFLPFAHILGRVEMWLSTYAGFTLAFAESIEKIKDNLLEIRPTVIIGVPRIFEKFHAGILSQLEGHSWRRKVFELSTEPVGGLTGLLWSIPQRVVAENLIYGKIRAAFGGRLRFAVCGGAPLAREICDFFFRAGILLLEGYGLTETTGAVCANTPDAYRFGTVGRPLGDARVKIADDGEILVAGSMVMQRYYRDDEATRTSISDGFFYTGDIGELSRDGYLKITDRKKDLIKTSGGKYVAPQKLENLLKANPLISNVLIHGDDRKYIVALITLDDHEKKKLAAAGEDSPEQLQSRVLEIVKQANSHLASFETIKNFAVLPKDFTVEAGELTPSLKLKRKVADQKYRDLINSLY